MTQIAGRTPDTASPTSTAGDRARGLVGATLVGPARAGSPDTPRGPQRSAASGWRAPRSRVIFRSRLPPPGRVHIRRERPRSQRTNKACGIAHGTRSRTLGAVRSSRVGRATESTGPTRGDAVEDPRLDLRSLNSYRTVGILRRHHGFGQPHGRASRVTLWRARRRGSECLAVRAIAPKSHSLSNGTPLDRVGPPL